MADQIDRRFTILAVLVVGLLAAVIVQSVVIFGMNRKLGQQGRTGSKPTLSIAKHDHNDMRPKALAPTGPMDQDDDPFVRDFDNWDPFKEMHNMQDRINQMFGNAFNQFQQSDDFGALFRNHPFAPDINIEDKGDHFLVTVDLPGTEDSQLDVKLEGQTLTISGSVQSESKETGKGTMLRQERRSGKFQRTVTLPSPVKVDKMTTSNKKGVVTITIPKATE
jgi:HSP20 family protein